VRYAIPPELPAAAQDALREPAVRVFRALDCRDVARIDFRLAADGTPWFLEANPLPGLSPEKGDIVLACAGAGISYPELVARIAARAIAEARRRRAARQRPSAGSPPRP
jgi:D-alanine-D-alanine ligase